ncbi:MULTISPECIES: DMT family transporter [unclassified Streptomyces]|uniref:EamA family transporter n=1 Tax=unclassified Streptomyces TaxID=2593676 RepID=UPI00278C0EDA|nr:MULTISPECIES: EamA family transporter [unclassified Streptomyces]
MTGSSNLSTRLPWIGLVLLSMLSLQTGTVLAKTLFAAGGVIGVTFLRSAFSAVVLWALTRPRPRTYSARQWGVVLLLGVVTATMNLTLYGAAARIPVGTATAVGFLGPITVAVVRTRRSGQLVWPALAYAGVLLLSPVGDLADIDPLGLLIAVVNAVCWGLYIVLTARTGALFPRADGLALSTAIGAAVLLVLFVSAGEPGRILDGRVLLLGFVMAMTGTAIPYASDYAVLRRIPQRSYGILLSLEPAVAAVLAWVGLGEALGGGEILAMGMIVAAAAGGAWQAGAGRRRRADDQTSRRSRRRSRVAAERLRPSSR